MFSRLISSFWHFSPIYAEAEESEFLVCARAPALLKKNKQTRFKQIASIESTSIMRSLHIHM